MRLVPAGSTDQTLTVYVYDTAGDPVTLTSASAGLSLSYRRDTDGREGTAVSMTPVARSGAGVHTDGAITSKGNGKHEIDVPDAAAATGADSLTIVLTADDATGDVYAETVSLSAAADTANAVWAAQTDDNVTTGSFGAWVKNSLAPLSSVNAISNKIGSFSGSGVETIKGAFVALMRSDGTALSAIGGTYDPATDSLQATADRTISIAAKTELISSGSVTITSPVAADGTTITVVQGDDYSNDDGRAITWTGTDADQWPDLTGATLEFTARMKGAADITAVPTVVTPTGTQVFCMELSSTDTDVTTGRYRYDVQATLDGGNVATLLNGAFVVQRTYTDAP